MTPLNAPQGVDGYGFSEVDDGAVKISRLGQIGVSGNSSRQPVKRLNAKPA